MYSYYDKFGLEDQPYAKYPVYQPKTSSEYYSVMNKTPKIGETPAVAYKVSLCQFCMSYTTPGLYDFLKPKRGLHEPISAEIQKNVIWATIEFEKFSSRIIADQGL